MQSIPNWPAIRRHFNRAIQGNLHVSVASITHDNTPTVTPVGSMFLNSDQTGFYFEKYVSKLPKNVETHPHICVLAVDSGKWFWFKSLFNNRFVKSPGIKLYGTLGIRRKPTDIEISRWKRRSKYTSFLKGHKTLWGDDMLAAVREIKFERAEWINLGKMTLDKK